MTQIHRDATQRGFEFQTWIALCLHLEVESYLEIGFDTGWTLEYASRYLLDARVLAVDIAPKPAIGTPQNQVVIGSSHDPEIIDKVYQKFGQRWPEAVFIDGDHTYAGSYRDWENWGIHARICGFHDISTYSLGCAKLWRDLREKHRSIEIEAVDVESRDRWEKRYGKLDGFGIGVIFKDDPQGNW